MNLSMFNLSTKNKTILGVVFFSSITIVTLYASYSLNKEESLDTRSSASNENQEELKYGVHVRREFYNGGYDPETTHKYNTVIKSNFSSIMYGSMAFWAIHDEAADVYDWEDIDNVVNWGKSNNIDVQLASLMWHNFNDDWRRIEWYEQLPSDESRIHALEDHIETIMNRYKDDITAMYVVNHPLRHNGDGNYMMTGLTIEEVTVRAFKQVNEIDTDITYIVNAETRAITGAERRNEYVEYINAVNSQLPEGSKIDAVGIMGHLGYCNGAVPDIEMMDANINYLALQTGLPIWITELDVAYDGAGTECEKELLNPREPYIPGDGNTYDTWFDYQADQYQKLYRMFKDNPNVELVNHWGHYDGKTWRVHAGFFFGPDDLEGDFTVKPSYQAVKGLLCTPFCPENSCGFDGCGDTCGSCDGDKKCFEGLCRDQPVGSEYPKCEILSASKTTVQKKDESVKITVKGEAGDGSNAINISLLAAAGGQLNKKPEDFSCNGTDEDNFQYSYYCNGVNVWNNVKTVDNSKDMIFETSFQKLEELIDNNISSSDGKEYEGVLEEKGIQLTVNVRGTSNSDICSSNPARNNGEGAYYNYGKWDRACDGKCNILLKYSPPDPAKKQCREECSDSEQCDTGLTCVNSICHNEQCIETDDEECSCSDDPPKSREEDLNNDNVVNMLDLSQVLTIWGENVQTGTDEDLNDDLVIDMLDVSMILGEWD